MRRLSIQPFSINEAIGVGVNVQFKEGDLLFTTGTKNYVDQIASSIRRIGHVGITTGDGTVIHASCESKGVVEISVEEYMKIGQFQGGVRIFPLREEWLTLIIPDGVDFFRADRAKWIVAQELSKKRSMSQEAIAGVRQALNRYATALAQRFITSE